MTSPSVALRRAAVRATLAPSIHNTQPWTFVLRPDRLELRADWTRRLRAVDPAGRQLVMSCGCALFNARASLAASGFEPSIERVPDPVDQDTLAVVRVDDDASSLPEPQLAALGPVIDVRHTNRRRFADDPVDPSVIADLVAAAGAEGVQARSIEGPELLALLADLSLQANAAQGADPAYRAELRKWTSRDPARGDGVVTEARSGSSRCVLLLSGAADTFEEWLRAGEAFERVLLEATRRGYATNPQSQVVEVPRTREALRQELTLTGLPMVLLRVGRAHAATPARRRLLAETVQVAATT